MILLVWSFLSLYHPNLKHFSIAHLQQFSETSWALGVDVVGVLPSELARKPYGKSTIGLRQMDPGNGDPQPEISYMHLDPICLRYIHIYI